MLRNAFVIILGFIPLVLASLGPYVTVGAFFAMLMTFSALTTLLLLPALMRVVGFRLMKKNQLTTEKHGVSQKV
ncbi:MAG: MMPL family transporter [bacterium]